MRYWVALLVCAGGAGAQTLEWSYETPVMPQGPTLYPNADAPEAVAVCAGPLAALLEPDGTPRWTAEFPGAAVAPLLADDLDGDGSTELVALTADGAVVCLDAQGRTRWFMQANTQGNAFDLPAAADFHPAPGREIAAGFSDGWLYCIGANGEVLWRFFGDRFRVGCAAIGDVTGDGFANVAFGTDNGRVFCLTGAGTLRWCYSDDEPYGRSAPQLADLDRDGRAEVLVTRSNAGIDRGLLALDGPTGTRKWRTENLMQSYCSIALADLDGDGALEAFNGDKGNWLYCTRADGAEVWRTELAGRGIFWGPVVADFDGDGAPEVVAPVRDNDPGVKASHFLLDHEGNILAPLRFGGNGNAPPAAGDIDGDGVVELIVSVGGPNAIQAYSWGGKGTTLWPGVRGASSMAARGNVPAGAPAHTALPEAESLLELSAETLYLGRNEWTVTLPQAAADAERFCTVAVAPRQGMLSTQVCPVKDGAPEARLEFDVWTQEETRVHVALWAAGETAPRAVWTERLVPEPADSPDISLEEDEAALRAGLDAGANVDGIYLLGATDLAQRLQLDMAQAKGSAEQLAREATALRHSVENHRRLVGALTRFWNAGHTGSFVYWQDENPWDRFDPGAMPDELSAETPIHIRAFGEEHEDVALNLLNITGKPITVRCLFSKPRLDAKPEPEPALAERVTLRRGVRVPGRDGMVLDALPELDRSRTITLPPLEVVQLWLVADTHALESGTHEITLYLGSLEPEMTLREVPVTLKVSPVRLPVGVYAQMNWVGVGVDQTSDQQFQDMIDHGISVAYGPPLPTLTLDANGELAEEPDWSVTDAGLARCPDYFQFLWHAPPRVQWPEGAVPEAESPLADKGFATAVRVMTRHLAEQGFGYARWAFYPYDEPWLTGFTIVPLLRAFCERVKAVDPKVRTYTDPTGLMRVAYVDEFRNLIDIWQPEMNVLKRDHALLKWFQENAPTFWAYEATDPGKDLLPLGYYRAFAWLAWRFGCDGAGFWVYKYHDIFWPLETPNWAVVYPTGGEVTPSRRWEACRDGQEDYRLLYAVRALAEKARAAGRRGEADAADKLITEAVAAMTDYQVREIDEITRQTRDYEVDYDRLLEYRERLGEAARALQEDTP